MFLRYNKCNRDMLSPIHCGAVTEGQQPLSILCDKGLSVELKMAASSFNGLVKPGTEIRAIPTIAALVTGLPKTPKWQKPVTVHTLVKEDFH